SGSNMPVYHWLGLAPDTRLAGAAWWEGLCSCTEIHPFTASCVVRVFHARKVQRDRLPFHARRGHQGTTCGEIQLTMLRSASSSPMRCVAENGTAFSAPISASSFLTAKTALMRCP